MNNTTTPAAMCAAKAIFNEAIDTGDVPRVADIAEIIDRETHVGELLGALKIAFAYLDANRPKGKIRDIFEKLNEHENGVMEPIRLAIARAEGRE